MRTARALSATAVACLAVACGSSGGSTHPSSGASQVAGKPDSITIQNFAYNELTVAPGATVTVTNEDAATHTVTADDKSFDSGFLAKGKSSTITAPTAPGKYTYYCTIHTYMKGTLTVS